MESGAQAAFSSLCPTLTFSEYCSAPWQVSTAQTCCGVCPSPAINALGTICGLIIASFFNLLIVLFQPASSAIYICAQLMLGNMFVVAVMVRNAMGTVSNGTNAIQKWHAEFAFLLASSSSALIVACLLSDVHHIHGFGRKDQLHRFQVAKATRNREPHVRGTRTPQEPVHPLFQRNGDGLWQRLRKFFARRQAAVLFFTFFTTQIYWVVLYGTIWWGDRQIYWQSNCEDLIGPANIALIHGVSFVFIAISIVSSLLLAIPVFMSISASEFLVRLFHFQEHHPLHPNSSLRLRLKVQNHIRRGKLGADDGTLLDLIHVETRAEKRVKVALSLVVWGFWLASLLVIYFRALNDFLLVGTPWPYAGIQNLLFGCFPAVKFFISPVRELR
ncbi:hypothetical protein JCM16303_000133 [Sporobolomyces ruberrimus]